MKSHIFERTAAMVDGFQEFCNGTLWASISIWNSESSLKPQKLLNLNIECQQVNGLCVNMSNDCTLNACKHLLCNWHVLIEGLNPNWNHLYKNYTDLSIALNDVLLEKKTWQFYAFSVTEWDFVVKQLLPTVHRLLSEHTVSVGALWVSVGHPPILSACPSLFQRWWCTTSPTELAKCLQKCRKLS